jgi:hypothetical protein
MKNTVRTIITAAALAAMVPAYAATADTPMSGTTKPTGSSMTATTPVETNVNHGSGAATDNVTKQTPDQAQAARDADANAATAANKETKPKKQGFFARLFHRGDKNESSSEGK